jgi:glycerophosphoryl diester phosphodiesterase
MTPMTRLLSRLPFVLLLVSASWLHAGILRPGKVQLLCHRTANRDLPENTLESLALAARIGCTVVEVDVTRTLDGELVLNHDNFLDRFTNSTGDVEHTELRELDRMDFGAWRSPRFRGMHIAHLDDALRLARKMDIGLYLDIKTKGIGPQVLTTLAQEGMTERVIFGGEWDDIKALNPHANEDPTAGLEPGFNHEQVEKLHAEGKFVIANFIFNGHEADLASMKAAVAAGVDGIMVDYPRLGAEALGRPVETKLGRLSLRAENSSPSDRISAIRELSEYTGFPLQRQFLHWMLDPDEAISHEATLALVISRPAPQVSAFEQASRASAPSARRNAAWAIGMLSLEKNDPVNCVPMLLPMLSDHDTAVVKEALLAITWCPASTTAIVPPEKLLPFLSSLVPILRGLAAVALAKYQPSVAANAVPHQLEKEEADAAAYEAAWAKRGHAKLTQAEIDDVVELYRCEIKLVQALTMLPENEALKQLASQAFRPVHDYSNVVGLVAGYQLWDRLDENPQLAITALTSPDIDVADRAEWTLIEAGPSVLPAVRDAARERSGIQRQKLIRILAWQADRDALPFLREIERTDASNRDLIQWAIAKIESLRGF